MKNIQYRENYQGKRYGRVDVSCVENPKLSALAKAVHFYCMSRPKGWTLRMSDISKRFKECADSIYESFVELEVEGYLIRDRERIGGRFQSVQYHWFECPLPKTSRKIAPFRKLPDTVSPETVSPHTVESDT